MPPLHLVSTYAGRLFVTRLTILSRELTTGGGDVRINSLGLLLGKRGQVIPVSLEGVGDLVCDLRCAELEDGVVVEGEILCLLILAPDLLAFDTEDLHADASWCGDIVGQQLRGQGGVSHDHIVGAGALEHALCEVGWELADDQLSNDTLMTALVSVHQVWTWLD